MLDWFLQYRYIILFYLVIITFLIVKRKRIATQAKIILLYRTTWGLHWMEKYSQKFRQWIILLGYVGVGGGFIGLVIISYTLIKNLWALIATPTATSGVSLVLPGMNIPGLGVLPFWYWIIAIFIIAVVHEFSHGIVARAHNIKVKNTGIVFFGPIIGAFVEPDEEKMRRQDDIVQYSIFAAGAFSNLVLAVITLIILNVAFMPLQQAMVEPAGFTFDSYYNTSFPIEKAGIKPGTIITGINGITTKDFQQFAEQLQCSKPGQMITLATTENSYPLALTENPANPSKPFLGINNIKNQFILKEKYSHGGWKVVYSILEWFNGLGNNGRGFLFWLYLLSFGIGLFNLLPLPIVDGGRMAQVFLHKLKGPETGEKRYRQVSMFFLIILVLNLVIPFIGKLF